MLLNSAFPDFLIWLNNMNYACDHFYFSRHDEHAGNSESFPPNFFESSCNATIDEPGQHAPFCSNDRQQSWSFSASTKGMGNGLFGENMNSTSENSSQLWNLIFLLTINKQHWRISRGGKFPSSSPEIPSKPIYLQMLQSFPGFNSPEIAEQIRSNMPQLTSLVNFLFFFIWCEKFFFPSIQMTNPQMLQAMSNPRVIGALQQIQQATQLLRQEVPQLFGNLP